jgi:hypothetical protein
LTNKPKVKAGRLRRQNLDKLLVSIKDYIPEAKIVNRRIIIPQAIAQTPTRTFYPKLKAAVTRPRDMRLEKSTSYGGMDKNYREYRTNSLIRSCVNIRALMATNKGFKNEIFHKDPKQDEKVHAQLQEDHKDLIQHINDINKKVNADNAWKIALISMQLHGRAGFEKDREMRDGPPRRLVPLNGYVLEPEYTEPFMGMATTSDPWAITSYEYDGKRQCFQPEDILYFPHNSLDGKQHGVSDVEAILDQAQTKRMIMEEVLPEACTVAWSGVAVMQIDSSDMKEDEEDAYMQDLVDNFKPNKLLVVNQKVTKIEVIDTKPNLQGIMQVGEYLDLDIIGYFRIPPFILGRHREVNRATAYTQLDQWINGDITDLQRTLRRLIDDNWNDYLARQFLKLTPEQYEELDYRPKLVWNPIKMIDFIETGQTAAALKASDSITQREVYRILSLNPADIEKDMLADAEMRTRVTPPQPPNPSENEKNNIEKTVQALMHRKEKGYG